MMNIVSSIFYSLTIQKAHDSIHAAQNAISEHLHKLGFHNWQEPQVTGKYRVKNVVCERIVLTGRQCCRHCPETKDVMARYNQMLSGPEPYRWERIPTWMYKQLIMNYDRV